MKKFDYQKWVTKHKYNLNEGVDNVIDIEKELKKLSTKKENKQPQKLLEKIKTALESLGENTRKKSTHRPTPSIPVREPRTSRPRTGIRPGTDRRDKVTPRIAHEKDTEFHTGYGDVINPIDEQGAVQRQNIKSKVFKNPKVSERKNRRRKKMRFTPVRPNHPIDINEKEKSHPRKDDMKLRRYSKNERKKWKGHTVGADELAAGAHRWDGEMGDGGSFVGSNYHYGSWGNDSWSPTAPPSGQSRYSKGRKLERKNRDKKFYPRKDRYGNVTGI